MSLGHFVKRAVLECASDVPGFEELLAYTLRRYGDLSAGGNLLDVSRGALVGSLHVR